MGKSIFSVSITKRMALVVETRKIIDIQRRGSHFQNI